MMIRNTKHYAKHCSGSVYVYNNEKHFIVNVYIPYYVPTIYIISLPITHDTFLTRNLAMS